MSRATVCFSMYSDMSMRIIARSSSNMNSASALASPVLPKLGGAAPVGRASRFFERLASVVDLLFHLGELAHAALFGLPASAERGGSLLEIGELRVEPRETIARDRIVIARDGHAVDL